MAVIPITVYWDAICPWCYIGHLTLKRAIALYQKTYPNASRDTIVWTFHPFYRAPSAPARGIPWPEAVARKNGPERVDAIRTRMARVGRENGIVFSFESRIGSTRDCHRMFLRYARPRGWEAEMRVLEGVFKWHFEADGDVTVLGGLARVAVEAGVVGGEVGGEEAVLEFLRGGEGGDEVDGLVEEARGRGVLHVPTFEIGGVRVEGAEEVGTFYEALVAAREGTEGSLGEEGANVCG